MSRPELVYDALRQWLDGPSGLEEAIRRTVDDGLFPEEDVQFAVSHLRKSLSIDVLERWWKRAGCDSDPVLNPVSESGSGSDLESGLESDLESGSESGSDPYRNPSRSPLKILCLHAGNLPLVGLQDVVAVLLSGNRYHGKLSRKDPWLLASLLEVCRELLIPETTEYYTDIGHFKDLKADTVLFAGSGMSVPKVRAELDRLHAVHPGTKYLIRTAQTSVALIEKKDSADDLLEAVTRYQGRGCRSVSVVVSPLGLDQYNLPVSHEDVKNQFAPISGRHSQTELESRLYPEPESQPGFQNKPESESESEPHPHSQLYSDRDRAQLYRIAYAGAVGKLFRRVGSWLFLEIEDADQAGKAGPGVVLWMRGDEDTVDAVCSVLAGRLQTVYSDSGREELEPLEKAQRPEFDWKPDGMDTLQWLKEAGN
ncbi:MAG: hypothetical protein ACNA8K_00065 [Cyclonatronaceae bacterium]